MPQKIELEAYWGLVIKPKTDDYLRKDVINSHLCIIFLLNLERCRTGVYTKNSVERAPSKNRSGYAPNSKH